MVPQTFKASSVEVAAYDRAARASGMSKSDWIRTVLSVAAGYPISHETIAPVKMGSAREAAKIRDDEGDLSTQSFKVSDREIEVYEKASTSVGMKLRPWIRLILASASGVYDLPAQMARVANIQNKPVRDGEW